MQEQFKERIRRETRSRRREQEAFDRIDKIVMLLVAVLSVRVSGTKHRSLQL